MTDSAASFSPAHVAGFSSHTRAAVREIALEQICAGRGRVLHGITGFNRPRINPVRIPSTAVSPENLGSVVAAVPPFGMRRLAARTLERSGPNTVGARALAAAFISLCGGHRWLISNFSRSIMAAGKPAFLPLVHDANQPTCGFFKTLFFAPAFLPVPVLHESNMDQERSENAEIAAGKVRNVIR